jgi:hypothetical protein
MDPSENLAAVTTEDDLGKTVIAAEGSLLAALLCEHAAAGSSPLGPT